MKYRIIGTPVAWARPRLRRGTNKFFDSQAKQKEDIRLQMTLLRKEIVALDVPVSIDITFFMPIPKSTSKKKQKLLEGQHHSKRPDLDNLIKHLNDSLEGICWTDDAKIVEVTARKVYSSEPRTEFSIRRKDVYGNQEG